MKEINATEMVATNEFMLKYEIIVRNTQDS